MCDPHESFTTEHFVKKITNAKQMPGERWGMKGLGNVIIHCRRPVDTADGIASSVGLFFLIRQVNGQSLIGPAQKPSERDCLVLIRRYGNNFSLTYQTGMNDIN